MLSAEASEISLPATRQAAQTDSRFRSAGMLAGLAVALVRQPQLPQQKVQLMPDAAVLATILLVVGLFLLSLEFFIPSFGMIGLGAVSALAISFWAACKAWWGTEPTFFWSYTAVLVGGVPASLLLAVTIIERTRLGSHLRLEPPQNQAPAVSPELQQLKGRTGTAANVMTPGGIVLIDGQRYHAESLGMLIEAGEPVFVADIRGTRLLVSPAAEKDTVSQNITPPEDQPLGTAPNTAASKPDLLDFDIPAE